MPKKITFVRGFRPPNEEEIDQAVGTNSPFSVAFKDSFDPLPKPKHELDWLAKYRVQGQTYDEYLDECPLIDEQDSSRQIIYLTLLANGDHLSLLDINALLDYTQRFFQMPVKLLPFFSDIQWDERQKTWLCKLSLCFGLT